MSKHPLQIALEGAGIETRPYSGRGMYGKRCLSVTFGARQDVSLGGMIAELVELSPDLSEADREEIILALHSMRQDSMGLGTVVYFPRVTFSAEVTP